MKDIHIKITIDGESYEGTFALSDIESVIGRDSKLWPEVMKLAGNAKNETPIGQGNDTFTPVLKALFAIPIKPKPLGKNKGGKKG